MSKNSAAGFDPNTLLFATIVESDDGIEYGMFVAPDGIIREFERPAGSHGDMNLWQTGNVADAIKRMPDISAALEMSGTTTTV